MPIASRLPLAALLLFGLAACGRTDDDASASSAAATPGASAAPASPTPSAPSSQEAQTIGIDAQGVGLVVAQWSVDHDFAVPADDAEFPSTLDYRDKLSDGEKAAYRKLGGKEFDVCVTRYTGAEPEGWGIDESTSGASISGVGAPNETFCP